MGRKRNPWTRLYTKILQCADYMESPLSTRVAWIAIICHASDVNDGGRLISGTKKLDRHRLARLANISVASAGKAIEYLLECGMLVRGEDGVLVVAHWSEYQSPTDSSTARVQKYRDNQNCNGEMALHVTEQEEEKEEEQKESNVDGKATQLATLLADLIGANLESLGYKQRTFNLRDSAIEISRLHRIDGVCYEDIERAIRWAQEDTFWRMNILSGAKLRKQYPQLLLKMETPAQKQEIPRFS